MATIFSKIISGEIPCYKVAENENYLAFLDISPLAAGHTLVIPKKEVDYIFNLDKETYLGLWEFAQKVALAVDAAMPCKRVVVSVIGVEVPHTHIHLIPLNTIEDCNFSRPKMSFPANEMNEFATKIVAAYKEIV